MKFIQPSTVGGLTGKESYYHLLRDDGTRHQILCDRETFEFLKGQLAELERRRERAKVGGSVTSNAKAASSARNGRLAAARKAAANKAAGRA